MPKGYCRVINNLVRVEDQLHVTQVTSDEVYQRAKKRTM